MASANHKNISQRTFKSWKTLFNNDINYINNYIIFSIILLPYSVKL